VAFVFRPLAHNDLPLLSTWLAAPHVLRWWHQDADLAAVEKEYGPALKGEEPTELFVVELAGEAIGFVQRYRIADYPHWVDALSVAGTPSDAAGIDYLLGREELTGRGVGAEMIVQFSDDTLRRYPDVSAIVVDVDQENRWSWRALEKAGYRRVWSGRLDSDDPSDDGPAHVYVLVRSVRT